MSSKGSLIAFINYKQAAQFGHIGWGFRLNADNYCFGSSDHLWKHDWWDLPAWWRYMHVPADGDIDWWSAQGSKEEMLEMMKTGPHIRYHAYKEIEADNVLPEQAVKYTEGLKSAGWHIAKHNCVHQAFQIFSTYTREHSLPNPYESPLNLIPKNWFARLPGSPQILREVNSRRRC